MAVSPYCDFDIDNSEPSFVHDTPPHDNAPPYQVWLKMVDRCRRYCPDKDRRTDRQNDSNSGGGRIKKHIWLGHAVIIDPFI